MGDRSLFISSCSRRDLARRRPSRGGSRLPVVLTLIVLAICVAAVLVASGVI